MATRSRSKAGTEITSCCPTCGQIVKPKAATKASRKVPTVTHGGPIDYSGPRPKSWLGVWPPLTLAQLAAHIPASFDAEEHDALVS